jgi:hypothetical protein
MNREMSPEALAPVPQGPDVIPEETLITDARAGLRPFEMVQRKLISLSKSQALPASVLAPVSSRLRDR